MPLDAPYPSHAGGRPLKVAPRTGRKGRPATRPVRPGKAANGIEAFKFHDEWIIEHMRLRDLAFEKVVRSGMTSYQIAKALEVDEGTVRYWAKKMDLTLRKVATDPPTAQAVIARRRRNSSVLFGDLGD
jgi:hypothetical protein